MNFFVSIICAINIYLSTAVPIAKLSLPVHQKDPCDATSNPHGCGKIVASSNTTNSNSILLQFRNNPVAFVSAMSKADPDTLREVLVLLNGLLDTSNSRETELVDHLNAQVAQLGQAETDVEDAENVLENANNALNSAQAAVASAESDLANKRDVRSTQLTEKNDAQANHDAEIDSLNNEQAMLEQVIQILEDLLGRQPTEPMNGEHLLDHNGQSYYKVQVSGVMSSTNIAAACVADGHVALCSGPDGCGYNDENCKVTDLSVSCGNPMRGVSHQICNGQDPRSCDLLNGVYSYMLNWSGHNGCGTEDGSWCSNGGNFNDRWALCTS